MKMLVGCIGSGNMGSALMGAVAAAAGGSEILVSDADAGKARDLAAKLGAAAASNRELVERCRFVVLAVKPQVLDAVLADLAEALADAQRAGTAPILVSIVAGASLTRIRDSLGAAGAAGLDPASLRIVRFMPNTPALVGQGVIAAAAGAGVTREDMDELERLFSGAGIFDRIDEKYLDAVTALSGSGPAFVYLFIEALADGGVRAGLPRDTALRYAARTVLGSAAMVEGTGVHPGALKDAVCSPGGTTIAGVAALEDRGFRGAAMAAVEAAFRRSKELG